MSWPMIHGGAGQPLFSVRFAPYAIQEAHGCMIDSARISPTGSTLPGQFRCAGLADLGEPSFKVPGFDGAGVTAWAGPGDDPEVFEQQEKMPGLDESDPDMTLNGVLGDDLERAPGPGPAADDQPGGG